MKKKAAGSGNLYDAVMAYLQFKNKCEREAGKEPQIKLPELPEESKERLNAAIKDYVDAVKAGAKQGGKT